MKNPNSENNFNYILIILVLLLQIISYEKEISSQVNKNVNSISQKELQYLSDNLSDKAEGNNSFVAFFKDTLIELPLKEDKETLINIHDNEVQILIETIINSPADPDKNPIYTFDTLITGRRCYGTIITGKFLSSVKEISLSNNILYLYSPASLKISRIINGVLVYKSNTAGWEMKAQIEE